MEKIYHLGNNLSVLMDQVSDFQTAVIKLMFRVGSVDDPQPVVGISHFLEHMLFGGTTNKTAEEIAATIDNLGGYSNAYTSKESTAYWIRVAPEHVPAALSLFAELWCHSTFLAEKTESERKVILQEVAESEDSPEDTVFRLLSQAAHPDHMLAAPIAGTRDTVAAITRADLLQHHATYYAPNNAILSISGKFDEEAATRQIDQLFGDLSPSPAVGIHGQRGTKPQYRGGLIHQKKDIEQIHLCLGFPGSSLHDAKHSEMILLDLILGGGMSSRLFQEVRERRGLAYSISSFHQVHREAGVFGVNASTSPELLGELLQVTMAELLKTLSEIGAAEVERAKAQCRLALLMERESSRARLNSMLENYIIFGEIIPFEETLAKIEAVTPAALQEYASTIFHRDAVPSLSLVGNLNPAAPEHQQRYDRLVDQIGNLAPATSASL